MRAGTANLEQYLDERVVVSLDGAACEQQLRGTSVDTRADQPGKAYAVLDLVFACPGSAGSFRIRYGVFAEAEAVADDHTNIAQYEFGERGEPSGRFVFDRAHTDLAIGQSSAFESSLRFGVLGVEHILLGLDHVLFVVALILGAANVRGLLKVTSMFTVAHSVTLVATLLGGIAVPAAIVEPLIALSIAFVAAENLIGPSHTRMPVVFGFGLLHGLGFAGSLRITDEASWDLALSLLSFNVGIEVGQAMLLAVVFPLVLLVRTSRFSIPIVRTATSGVAGFGLYWFVERFFLT